MRYVSTRGSASIFSFEAAVLSGLASDGGLYVPESVPQFSATEWAAMAEFSYTELAYHIMQPFISNEIEGDILEKMIEESYAGFRHSAIAPLKQLSGNHFLLELFHGPTLAFKDFALQFLGRLLGHFLEKNNRHAVIVGATSGDTGSAAIAGLRGRERMDVYILHPAGRVSEVQRRQMTSIADANVHNIAIDGTFDDCQDIVKALFADEVFRVRHNLSAINSINWARVLAQVVYYAYAALRLGAPHRAISFSVPTGNFGDIYAGYVAKKMGLNVGRLIIASNRNDILTRCLMTGCYEMQGVAPSHSPSMDIELSSNFERFLFDAYGRDGGKLGRLMATFRKEKKLMLDEPTHAAMKVHFDAKSVSDDETLAKIRYIHETTGELLDPHSAVGVAAADAVGQGMMVTLATAHPAKFPDAVEKASGIRPLLPAHMKELFDLAERCEYLPNDLNRVKKWIENTTRAH